MGTGHQNMDKGLKDTHPYRNDPIPNVNDFNGLQSSPNHMRLETVKNMTGMSRVHKSWNHMSQLLRHVPKASQSMVLGPKALHSKDSFNRFMTIYKYGDIDPWAGRHNVT